MTSPRNPGSLTREKMCSELHGDMQKRGIKRPRDNTLGILGGGTAMLGTLGLVAGATL
jgi:hypothetical protein